MPRLIVLVLATLAGCSKPKPTQPADPAPAPGTTQGRPTLATKPADDPPDPPTPQPTPAAAAAASKAIEAAGGTISLGSGSAYVKFAQKTIPDGLLKELASVPNLGGVTLDRCEVSDAALKGFPRLPELSLLVIKNCTGFTDAGILGLPRLRGVRNLVLTGAPVTDAALPAVGRMTGLSDLDLTDTGVAGPGLKELASLPNLATLRLNGTKVTGPGLKDLAGVGRLITLHLDRTGLGDAAVKDLPAVQEVSLNKTGVTDVGLAELPARVQVLCLNDTAVTDAGVRHVAARCPDLVMLDVSGTGITDAVAPVLGGLSKFGTLTAAGTKMTAAGAADLKARRPGARAILGP